MHFVLHRDNCTGQKGLAGANQLATRLIESSLCLMFFSSACMPLHADEKNPTNTPPSLKWMDIDQLSRIKITSVSKRPESVSKVPAAVRVLTGDDILRSGATSIPEALRSVPGLNVAQIHGSSWGIGARGYQAQYASKLLVLMDGRSVYTPLFGGVLWDVQDYLMEDLEQIEVVLGPGGSIWGANAVNGVINIISKSAKDTQGGLTYAGGGSEKMAMAGGRYGWKLGESTYARAYAKYASTDDTRVANGMSADDSFQIGQSGFRMDGYKNDVVHWTLQGDVYAGREEYRADLPSLAAPGYQSTSERITEVSGANLLGRWEREFSPESKLRLQAYYDYAQRLGALPDARVQTGDFELQHTLSLGERNKFDWGLGCRMVRGETGNGWIAYEPRRFSSQLYSGFIQDELWLVQDKLSLTAGVKLEHHDATGWEPQPNVRLAWHPTERQTLWAAWSQAVRVPSMIEQQGQFDARVFPPGVFNPALPAAIRIVGNSNLDSEQLRSWETGWRWQASDRVSLDISGFYYSFNHLSMIDLNAPYVQVAPIPAVILPAPYGTGLHGEGYGGEIGAEWRPIRSWKLRASYSYVQMQLHTSKADPFNFEQDELTTPHHSVVLSSSANLGKNWSLDSALRYMDIIPYYSIPSYMELDARLAWRPHPNLELALVGQNLLHSQHPEYKAALVGRTAEIERSVYAKVTLKF